MSLAGCSPGDRGETLPASQIVIVDDAFISAGLNRFERTGKWEHARGRSDGRHAGTCSRSMHIGDAVLLRFVGSRVHIYGIKGRNGGDALERPAAERSARDKFRCRWIEGATPSCIREYRLRANHSITS